MDQQLEFESLRVPLLPSPVQSLDVSSQSSGALFFRGARPLTANESYLLLQAAKHKSRNAALLALLYFAALRISEATSLRWMDLAFSSDHNQPGCLRLRRRTTKGKRIGVTLPLHPKAQTALRHWLSHQQAKNRVAPGDFIFPGKVHGSKLSRISAWEMIKRVYARAGMTAPGYALHSLRKGAAGAILAATHNIEIVRQTLRHSRLETTQAYLAEDAKAVGEAILAL